MRKKSVLLKQIPEHAKEDILQKIVAELIHYHFSSTEGKKLSNDSDKQWFSNVGFKVEVIEAASIVTSSKTNLKPMLHLLDCNNNNSVQKMMQSTIIQGLSTQELNITTGRNLPPGRTYHHTESTNGVKLPH